MSRRYLSFALSIMLTLSCTAAMAYGIGPFNGAVAFGDSLSDNGNIHSRIPLSQPRFTTNPGKTSVEYLATYYGFDLKPSVKGGNDYAWGGALVNVDADSVDADPFVNTESSQRFSIPSMKKQLNQYLDARGGQADANTLYTMWIGANDVMTAAESKTSYDAKKAIVDTAAHAELDLIKKLHDAGASYIVVFNLPDIGKTPEYRKSEKSTELSALTDEYNDVLNAGLDGIGMGIIPVNTHELFNSMLTEPARYGLKNVTDKACTGMGAVRSIFCTKKTLVSPDAADTYLFADGVHPTIKVHALVAKQAISGLENFIYGLD